MEILTALIVFLGSVEVASTPPRGASSGVVARVDHLIYATPDLDRSVAWFRRRIGVEATPGGSSPERGTHNALIALGPATYLEIVAPDPSQPNAPHPPWWLRGLRRPRLVQWAVKGTDLERVRAEAIQGGVPLGEVLSGSRRRPDGVVLDWRFTSPREPIAGGIVPFVIDWGESPHPATSSVPGARLTSLRAEHPDPPGVQGMLDRLGLELGVTRGRRPALIATIEGPRGRLELR